MNANLMLDERETAKPEYQQTQGYETDIILEAVKSTLQTSLVGESQNFRSSVAAAQRKFHQAQRLALLLIAFSCFFSSLVMLAGIWQAHRVINHAEATFQNPQVQAASSPDAFADLRQANLEPIGKLITQKGRTFIELQPAK